jgi:cytosine/adenosine deaminase-related metal-dependent hydrolase
MFEEGKGELYEWLVRLGRDMYDCGGVSSLEMLHRQGVLNNHTFGIHLNGLDEQEMGVVAGCGMSVVHCPSSHEFFDHPPFGLEQLLARGVNVCVGTDSLASAPGGATLDMFAELRALRRAFPRLSAETILRMATVNGAKALHAADRLGTIERGKWADLIALRLPPRTRNTDVYELVVSGQLPLCFAAIHGELIRGAK